MDSLKDFSIAITFVLVASVCILFFSIGYPALNGKTSVLLEDSKFNDTANELVIELGGYQDKANTDTNISISDEPQVSAETLQLVSTTSVSRNILGRTTSGFKIITNFLGNLFGLSGTQFIYISGALLSLFAMVLLYYVIKFIRVGY